MKRLLWSIPLLVLGLSSCLKDDLDPAKLTSNPLDPDYDGPALIELVSDTTRVIFNNGLPVDTVVEQTIHINDDLLPPGTDYALYVTLVNTGEVFDYSSAVPVPQERPYHHVVAGTSYCFDYRLKVQFSLTKSYAFCTIANP